MQVGQLVTWPKVGLYDWLSMARNRQLPPQLHIIENRYRLERQILQGRQTIRKLMQPRTGERTAHRVDAQGTILPSMTVTKSTAPPITPGISLEGPLPMDSDAEVAFTNGMRPHRLHQHKLAAISPSATLVGQRAAATRRRWSVSYARQAENADPIAETDYGRATPDPPPLTEAEADRAGAPPSPTSAAGFLKRLRTASATFSPFSSLRRMDRVTGKGTSSQAESLMDPPWSGDSSSDDDDLSMDSRRHIRNPSVLEFLRNDDGSERIYGDNQSP